MADVFELMAEELPGFLEEGANVEEAFSRFELAYMIVVSRVISTNDQPEDAKDPIGSSLIPFRTSSTLP